MTAIAVKAGLVVADSQATLGNYAMRVQKMVRLPDGGVAVGAGMWPQAYAALVWLAQGEHGAPPDIEEASIVIVRPDHTIWLAQGMFPAFPILDDEYAGGCAQDLIRSLMAEGCGPLEAVVKACELDNNSSAPVISMQANPAPEPEGPSVHTVKRARKGMNIK